MLNTLVRRATVGVTAAVLMAALGGCGTDEKKPGASATASSEPSVSASAGGSSDGPFTTAFQPKDVPDPGDDLLDRIRKSAVFSGAMLKASWKFPESFESEPLATTKAYSKDKRFRITMGLGQGDQAKAEAALEDARRQAVTKGQKATFSTVTVAGREYAVLVQDTPEVGILTYAHAPKGSQQFFVAQFASDVPLADVPKEQLDGFLQTVGSMEFENP